MKKIAIILISLLSGFTAIGQEITGQWNGLLKVQGTQLRIVFNINKTDSGYTSTMDSPDQGAKGIHVSTTTVDGNELKLEIATAKIEYTGELKEGIIVGTFKQSGLVIPLDLSREELEKEIVKRPQNPTLPYPYFTEEVAFQNPNANITLAGTLCLPKKEGNFPVVVLITGSGPQNRDEELLGHKPFLIISDYLTRNGIAVLRYDDRGVAKSTGDFQSATSMDFASDVESAIAYLKTRKEINPKKIGLIGHSEGGIIAPMVAAKSKDVNFIVLLAGTGIRGDKLLLMQQELIARASGVSDEDIEKTKESNTKVFDMVLKSKDSEALKTDLTNYIKTLLKENNSEKIPQGMTEDQFIARQVNQITNPWMQYFIKYDPSLTLEKVKCAVLAINGGKDLQVPPKENLSAIEKSLKKAGNKKFVVKELPNLNHLFQECKTGSPSEYSEIEQTFSPIALDEITKWIINQTK
jgi:pimeloyl-ACP methyl ester carboxylesterase